MAATFWLFFASSFFSIMCSKGRGSCRKPIVRSCDGRDPTEAFRDQSSCPGTSSACFVLVRVAGFFLALRALLPAGRFLVTFRFLFLPSSLSQSPLLLSPSSSVSSPARGLWSGVRSPSSLSSSLFLLPVLPCFGFFSVVCLLRFFLEPFAGSSSGFFLSDDSSEEVIRAGKLCDDLPRASVDP